MSTIPEPKQPDLYHKPTIDDALKPTKQAIPEPTPGVDCACPFGYHAPMCKHYQERLAEPELNVEAELDARIWHIVQAYGKSGDSELDKACRYRQHDEIVVLIQQVSDQRMRDFVALLKASYFEPHEKFFHVAIEAALKDYLSHKEAE